MEKYPATIPISFEQYSKHEGPYATKFGLPAEVKFCKRCVISNQRPSSELEYAHTIDTVKRTIQFDAEGICDACRFAEQKKQVIERCLLTDPQLAAAMGRAGREKVRTKHDPVVAGREFTRFMRAVYERRGPLVPISSDES